MSNLNPQSPQPQPPVIDQNASATWNGPQQPQSFQGPVPPTPGVGVPPPAKPKMATLILKGLALGFGLLALCLTAAALANGRYFNYKCTDEEKVFFELTKPKKSPNDKGSGPGPGSRPGLNFDTITPTTCEATIEGTSEFCDLVLQLVQGVRRDIDQVKQGAQAQGRPLPPDIQFLEEILNEAPKDCPSHLMVTIPVVMIALAWVAGLCLLIVSLVAGQKSPTVKSIDSIGHLVAGILFLISTLTIAGFLIAAFSSNYPCTQKGYELREQYIKLTSAGGPGGGGFGSIKGGGPGGPGGGGGGGHYIDPGDFTRHGTGANSRIWGFSLRDGEILYETCSEEMDNAYKTWLLIIGTVLGVTTSVLYLVTFGMLKKQDVGPSGQFGQPTPSYALTQLQPFQIRQMQEQQQAGQGQGSTPSMQTVPPSPP